MRPFALAAALLLPLLAAPAAGEVRVAARVLETLEETGSARVLVHLAPERGMERAAPGWLRRAAVARAQGDALGILEGTSHRVQRRSGRFPWLALELSPRALERLRRSGRVLAISEDALLAPAVVESVPQIDAPPLHALGVDGRGTAIAVIDTGVDASHAFLGSRVVEEACFSALHDCPNGARTQIGPGAAAPCTYAPRCDHGTHVAGIAAGDAGVAPAAEIVAVQIFSRLTGPACAGQGQDPCAMAFASDLLAGIEYVLDLAESEPIAAANASLGSGSWESPDQCDASNAVLHQVVAELHALGVATVAASGNRAWTDAMEMPACLSNVVSVGAVDGSDRPLGGSNSAPFLTLLAPGAGILSSVPGGGYGSRSGTSMASPHVAGGIALLRQAAPQVPTWQIVDVLRSTGLSVTDARNGVTTPRLSLADAFLALAPACANGVDDDGDGLADHPSDPGCATPDDPAETAPQLECDDGLDNDGDGFVDAREDPQCTTPATWRELRNACGLGPELSLLLAAWGAVRGVRRRARASRRTCRADRAAG